MFYFFLPLLPRKILYPSSDIGLDGVGVGEVGALGQTSVYLPHPLMLVLKTKPIVHIHPIVLRIQLNQLLQQLLLRCLGAAGSLQIKCESVIGVDS